MTEFEKNNFANFEASKAIREVGFDENCFAFYHNTKEFIMGTAPVYHNTKTDSEGTESGLFLSQSSAPLFTQAVRWFREHHSIELHVSWQGDGGFYLNMNLVRTLKNEWERLHRDWHKTEPEAYNAAIIIACEIVKAKSQIQSQTGL